MNIAATSGNVSRFANVDQIGSGAHANSVSEIKASSAKNRVHASVARRV